MGNTVERREEIVMLFNKKGGKYKKNHTNKKNTKTMHIAIIDEGRKKHASVPCTHSQCSESVCASVQPE